MNFLEISGLLFWASILICLLMLFLGYRNAQIEPSDTQIYGKEKARRNRPKSIYEHFTLKTLLGGYSGAAKVEWKDSEITYTDLNQIDELI